MQNLLLIKEIFIFLFILNLKNRIIRFCNLLKWLTRWIISVEGLTHSFRIIWTFGIILKSIFVKYSVNWKLNIYTKLFNCCWLNIFPFSSEPLPHETQWKNGQFIIFHVIVDVDSTTCDVKKENPEKTFLI